MEKKLNKELFTKFYIGDLSAKEEEALLQSKEANELLMEQWDNYDDIAQKKDEIDSELVFNKIQTSIQQQPGKERVFLRIAAAVVVVVSLVFGAILMNNSDQTQYIEYATLTGERLEVELPDGSLMKLNSNSKISFNERFDERIIDLEGEAYFNVVHNKSDFIVKTIDFNVKVLGTQFVVSNYVNQENPYTVLEEGKVQIEFDNKQIELKPNEKFELAKESNKAIVNNINTLAYIGWTNNKLVFDNTSFNVIIDQLEKWYGIEINSDKELDLAKSFTITIENETPEEVFELFNQLYPISFKKTNQGYILSSK